MENKKYLPIKIIHLILMVAAIVFCCLSLTKINLSTVNFFNSAMIVAYITEIIALISGIVYLAYGYKKNAAIYYKAFMVILVIAQAVFCYWQLLGVIAPEPLTAGIVAILNIVPLIMLTILATGKDLGKTKSYIIVAIILACRIGTIILDLVALGFGPIIYFRISDVLLAGTAFFMVTGKYLDKAARGTK